MLPTAPDISVTSTVTGDAIRLSLDEASLVHLMSQYIDLYTDAELAAVREYSTNALDAHVEAGESRPIEVTTPTALSPYLRIKDYGLGLTRQNIVDVYSKYGASTKRGSNDFQGMLGLGCKSGLAYTNQFTLTSVANTPEGRIKILVSVSRDEDGSATMTVINGPDGDPTDDPTGVEVTIPARGWNQMEEKAAKLFQYWPEGSVLLNDEKPTPFSYSMKVSDEIYVIKADKFREKSNSFVVMGNVAYPVEGQYIDHGLGKEQGLLAFLPIGSVEFTPAREALRYTRKTKDALTAVAESYQASRDKAIDREIQGAPDSRAAIATLLRLRKVFGITGTTKAVYKYQGKNFPNTLTLDPNTVNVLTSSEKRSGTKFNTHEKISTLDITYLPKTIFVRGWDQASFTATTKKKLMLWLERKHEAEGLANTNLTECNHFVLVHTMPDQTWISDSSIIEWPDIKGIRLPTAGRPQRADGTISDGEYEVTTLIDGQCDTSLMHAEDFDPETPIFWVYYEKDGSTRDHRDILKTMYDADGFYFVELWKNRAKKFLRLFPTAQPAEPECRVLADKWAATLSDADKLALTIDSLYDARDTLCKLKVDKIDDPAIKSAVTAARHNIKGLKAKQSAWGQFLSGSLTVEWDNPLDNYPMLSHMRSYRHYKGHEYIMMNAVYAASQVTPNINRTKAILASRV